MATPSIIKVHIRVLITVWTLGFGWLLHDSSATSSGGRRCWSCIRTSVADKRESTGISDVLCHHIKPDQHKFLKKYSLRLNYEVFQSLSLIAGLYLVGGVVSFLVIIIKSQDSGWATRLNPIKNLRPRLLPAFIYLSILFLECSWGNLQ